jgi:tRNA(Ile)-lysidine synthase TilS/MesJ
VCKSLGKELVLLHISYMNRPECEDECNLVRWWGQRLGVPVYIRRIKEIQRVRQSGLRTVYEEVTRRIRFAFYRWFDCPVILGHNLDDCYENVFSNLSKRIHLDNLYGMRDVGEEQGVVVLRPLLGIPKTAIVAYADAGGIPHLYDSTPAWSRRGQMRDRLIPGIREFDVGILEGLRAVVERTQFLEAQWSQAFDRWCRELVAKQVVAGQVVLPRDAFLESNRGEVQFWVRLFQWLGWPRPSNKSLGNFMDMLDRREGRCNLSGTMYATISNTNVQIILDT